MKIQIIKCSKVCNLLLLFMSGFNTSGTEPNSLYWGDVVSVSRVNVHFISFF